MMATFMASLPPSMVPRAMAPIRFSSLCSSSLGITTRPSVSGTSVSGTSILAIRMVPGRRHDHGGKQMPRLHALRNIHGHDAARNMRHAAGHDGHQFAARGAGKKWPDGERRLRLPHEDGRGDVHALRARDAHGLQHHPGHAADDDLHQADVIQHGEKRGDEDDGGQHLEREDRSRCGSNHFAESAGVGQAQFAEQNARSREGSRKHVGDDVAGPGHGALAKVEAQHKKRKRELQAQAPRDGAPANAAAVRGTQPGRSQHGENSEQSCKSSHNELLQAAASSSGSALQLGGSGLPCRDCAVR